MSIADSARTLSTEQATTSDGAAPPEPEMGSDRYHSHQHTVPINMVSTTDDQVKEQDLQDGWYRSESLGGQSTSKNTPLQAPTSSPLIAGRLVNRSVSVLHVRARAFV